MPKQKEEKYIYCCSKKRIPKKPMKCESCDTAICLYCFNFFYKTVNIKKVCKKCYEKLTFLNKLDESDSSYWIFHHFFSSDIIKKSDN